MVDTKAISHPSSSINIYQSVSFFGNCFQKHLCLPACMNLMFLVWGCVSKMYLQFDFRRSLKHVTTFFPPNIGRKACIRSAACGHFGNPRPTVENFLGIRRRYRRSRHPRGSAISLLDQTDSHFKKNANNCVKVNGDVFIPEFLHGKNISGKDRLYLGVNTMVNPINVDLMRKKHRMNSMCRTPRHSTSSTEQLGRLVSSSASGGSVLWRSFGRFF